MDPALRELFAAGRPDDEVAVVMRLAGPYDTPDGVRIVARFGDIATCRVRRGGIPDVWSHRLTVSMKAPRTYRPALTVVHENVGAMPGDPSLPEPQASDERRGDDLPTGRGSIVCHVDWGLDVAHPDFRRPDGRTRVLGLWDQGARYDPAHPNPYGYGRIHTAAEIDAALETPDCYAALNYDPADSDLHAGSHGTHVMGIAAGNGRSGGPLGLAPEADILFVHLSTATAEGTDLLGDSVAFLEALDFFARTARDRPFVVNASLGRICGPHDGLTPVERGMDAFLLAAPGRAIVQSTGNYFDRCSHTTDVMHPGKHRSIALNVESGDVLPTEVDLWYPGIDRFGIVVRGPGGVDAIAAEPGERAPVIAGGSEVGHLYHRLGDPNNGDNEVTLYLGPAAPSGRWEIDLIGRVVNNGRYHAWIERNSSHAHVRTHFDDDDCDPTTTLGTICNGLRTLAVGAYDAHDPDRGLAPFSSGGPTRDARELKPELVAPGVRVLSARSRPRAVDGEVPLLTRMSGTSMAAPMVTGTIALMFEAARRPLWIDETRNLLLAQVDLAPPDLDRVARLRLGNGFLNPAGAVAAARAAGQRRLEPGNAELTAVDLPASGDAERNMVGAPDALEEDEMMRLQPSVDGPDAWSAAEDEPVRDLRWEGEAEAYEDLAEAHRAVAAAAPPAAGLPFQVQVPLTGGAPAIAVPFGGAASPFAFTLPLGGSSTPVAVAVSTTATADRDAGAGPAAADLPPVTVAGGAPTDLGVGAPPELGGGEVGESADWGADGLDDESRAARIFAAAEALCRSERGRIPSSTLLRHLSSASVTDAPDADPAHPASVPSATALFSAFTLPDHAGGPPAAQRADVERRYRLVGRPGDVLAGTDLRVGDLVVRIARGEAWGTVAIVASPEFVVREDLAAAGLRGEGYPLLAPGTFVHVVEPGSRFADRSARFARRIGDAADRILPDTLLLRILTVSDEAVDEPGPAAGEQPANGDATHPVLRRGASGAAVKTLQTALNRVNGDEVALGLPGLAGCPLAEDGRFDRKTESAVLALQQQTLNDPQRWDGVVGAQTWKQLELLVGAIANPANADGSGARRAPASNGHVAPATAGESVAPVSAQPVLRIGSRDDAVAQVQRDLNRVSALQIGAGAAGLAGCPLVEDGAFGPLTRDAVIAFQQLAFPAAPRAWDGVVGPNTWAALGRFNADPQPVPPAVPTAGSVAAGRCVVTSVPLLQSHVGTPPDLILRWNAMSAIPTTVDVVVHLHGFSGRAAAMRLDVDKEPVCGLDFANPDDPADAGRTRPTLGVLARGNFYGGKSGAGYDFPALIARGALPRLIEYALAQFAASIGASAVAAGRLILTAHSGGGTALMALLAQTDPDEVHIFDGLYSDSSPLARWTAARLARQDSSLSALRVIYRAGTGTAANSRKIAQLLQTTFAASSGDARASRFRVETTHIEHGRIPRVYGWQFLRDAGADVAGTQPSEAVEEPEIDESAPDTGLGRPVLRMGSHVPAVRDLQQQLNAISAAHVAAGGLPLPACPLAEDAAFGRLTREAVIGFQMSVFPDSSRDWDGVVGPRTWAALDRARPLPPSPLPPGPLPPPQPAEPTQSDLDALASIVFTNAADISAFFARSGAAGVGEWFNARLAKKPPFEHITMNVSPAAQSRFNAFWDRLALAYDRPAIGVLEFVTLLSIVLNETGGDFANRPETSGPSGAGRTDVHGHPHPGLAYFYDRIELKGGTKPSYNSKADLHNKTAAALFNDPIYVAAHQARGGSDALANHGTDFGGVWATDTYPQDRFSTNETDAGTGFIRQADFYKFRGRGLIQTTGRVNYAACVRFVQGYSGSDPVLLDWRQRWNGQAPDDVATMSANEDWEGIFGSADMLARSIAIHAGSGPNDYRTMSPKASVFNAVPDPLTPKALGSAGSAFRMGRSISGNMIYAATTYRKRVFALLQAIVPLVTAAPPNPAPPNPAPPSPSPDTADLQAQWDAHPRVHGWFGSFDRYTELAPLYAANHISDSAKYLDDNTVTLSFFGHRASGHRDLTAPLAQVEAALQGQTVTPPIRSFGALNPRTIRGNARALSKHALGRAFDLDPSDNPRITATTDFVLIAAVTGSDIRQQTSPLTSPAALRAASLAFMSGFTDAWAAAQTDPAMIKALADSATRERCRGYATRGFFNLSLPLVQALIAAGLIWGGTWHTSKDFMHFELP